MSETRARESYYGHGYSGSVAQPVERWVSCPGESWPSGAKHCRQSRHRPGATAVKIESLLSDRFSNTNTPDCLIAIMLAGQVQNIG